MTFDAMMAQLQARVNRSTPHGADLEKGDLIFYAWGDPAITNETDERLAAAWRAMNPEKTDG